MGKQRHVMGGVSAPGDVNNTDTSAGGGKGRIMAE